MLCSRPLGVVLLLDHHCLLRLLLLTCPCSKNWSNTLKALALISLKCTLLRLAVVVPTTYDSITTDQFGNLSELQSRNM